MDVILLERIEKLGQMGDVVKVKNGFARNFLLPQKKALRASKDNLAYFEKERVTLEANNLKQKQEAELVLKKLDNYNLVIIRQAGETGQLYGSVNTNDVKATLNENGFIVEKNQIKLDKPIKELGVHAVSVKLHPEVQATISVIVSRTETEAEILLKGDELKIDSENISTDENRLTRINVQKIISLKELINKPINEVLFDKFQREKLIEILNENNIGNAIYYPLPLHIQKCFDHLGYKTGDLPESETAGNEVVSIPIYSELTEDQKIKFGKNLSSVKANISKAV